jgi:hypothetical protein
MGEIVDDQRIGKRRRSLAKLTLWFRELREVPWLSSDHLVAAASTVTRMRLLARDTKQMGGHVWDVARVAGRSEEWRERKAALKALTAYAVEGRAEAEEVAGLLADIVKCRSPNTPDLPFEEKKLTYELASVLEAGIGESMPEAARRVLDEVICAWKEASRE